MLILLVILGTVVGLVCWALWGIPKTTIWEKPDHRWFSYTFRSWLKNRPSMVIGAYTLRGKNLSPALDRSEARGDQKWARGTVGDAAPVAITEENETPPYGFVIAKPKVVKVQDYLVSEVYVPEFCADGVGEAILEAQKLLESYDEKYSGRAETALDPSIPRRMKSIENTEDFKLVSSVRRGKNESYQKPSGACDTKPAIQHFRGVRRRLD